MLNLWQAQAQEYSRKFYHNKGHIIHLIQILHLPRIIQSIVIHEANNK